MTAEGATSINFVFPGIHKYCNYIDALPISYQAFKDLGGGGRYFPPGSRFFANNFGSNNSTQSKLSDFS